MSYRNECPYTQESCGRSGGVDTRSVNNIDRVTSGTEKAKENKEKCIPLICFQRYKTSHLNIRNCYV